METLEEMFAVEVVGKVVVTPDIPGFPPEEDELVGFYIKL